MNYWLVLSFYSNILFAKETVLIHELIPESRFTALLRVSGKFSARLNVLAI